MAYSNPNKEKCMFADESDNAMVSTQQSLIGAANGTPIDTTYTSGSAPTASTSQTIANSATPTVVELLQYCKNLENLVDKLTGALIAHGLMADA